MHALIIANSNGTADVYITGIHNSTNTLVTSRISIKQASAFSQKESANSHPEALQPHLLICTAFLIVIISSRRYIIDPYYFRTVQMWKKIIHTRTCHHLLFFAPSVYFPIRPFVRITPNICLTRVISCFLIMNTLIGTEKNNINAQCCTFVNVIVVF